MLIFLYVVFAVFSAGLLHTYLLYPWLMKYWTARLPEVAIPDMIREELPVVSVISSLYNEELVLPDKLKSLQALDYPSEKLHIYLGSDCSEDATNTIGQTAAEELNNFYFFPFPKRRGKPPVINQLAGLAIERSGKGPGHILLFTDANVLLQEDTLLKLVRHFNDPQMGLVDSNMVPVGLQASGISKAEKEYLSFEVMLKNREGRLWGTMIGPFGGCFALRSDYFSPVPPKYLVDDFYLAMRVMEQGGKAVNDLEALAYEGISHDIWEEYRRKRRIAAGNFQNMGTFRKLWFPPFGPLGFSFFSHKILRWLGPFLMLGMLLVAGIASVMGNLFFIFVFISMTVGVGGIFLLDLLLKGFGTNILALRGIRYFFVMNLAIFEGFLKYINGIKDNVWQPPKRGG